MTIEQISVSDLYELAKDKIGKYKPTKEEIELDEISTKHQEGKIKTYGFMKGVDVWREYPNLVGTNAYNRKHTFNVGIVDTPKKLYDLGNAFKRGWISGEFVKSKLEYLL
jgi:hypothetical protein